VAAGLVHLGVYAGVALLRMTYPFELEWMEGGILDHVRRVLAGEPVFAKPDLGFVSFFYPPLYYYAAALPAALWGLDFTPLRALSFASSLGCAALLYAIVRRETGERLPGLVAACLYVAAFDRGGGWLDIARIDSFFMLLLLGFAYQARFARAAPGLLAAGALLAAASLVKQSALVIAAPLALQALLWDRRRGVLWIGSAAALGGASWLLLDLLHDGWLRYYTFTVPRQHPRVDIPLASFWTRDIGESVPVAAAAALAWLLSPPQRDARGRRSFYAALAVGAVAASWSVRSLAGAWHNNLLPVFAAFAVLAGLALHRALAWARAREAAGSRGATLRGAVAAVAWGLVGLQLGLLAYDPREHLPTDADRAAGVALVKRLRQIDGAVFLPHHGYLLWRAGKRGHAHTLAMDNLFIDDPGPAARDLRRQVQLALARQRYAAVIVESDERYLPWIEPFYVQRARLFSDPDVFRPVTGGGLRPELVYRPRQRTPSERRPE